ncbi:hypothetical protein ABK040_016414 [Willaertia magna]
MNNNNNNNGMMMINKSSLSSIHQFITSNKYSKIINKNFHNQLNKQFNYYSIVDENNVTRLHFYKRYWIIEQYKSELKLQLNQITTSLQNNLIDKKLEQKKNLLKKELDLYILLDNLVHQKINKLQFEIDNLEIKKLNLKDNLLQCELYLNYCKDELLSFKNSLQNENTFENIKIKFNKENLNFQKLKEKYELLEMEINDKNKQLDDISLTYLDEMELLIENKISFWKYFYPTILRTFLLTFIFSSIFTYLYYAVGVSIELRVGGDDEEEGDD